MKIIHSICAALMALAFVSCDEHREFPDTAMKTCDILCTDGKVVRYEEMEAQGKKPIAVSSTLTKPRTWRVQDMQSIFGTLHL